MAAKITSINRTRSQGLLCQLAREPWHIPFPFSARIPGLPLQAVPGSICCSCLRLIPGAFLIPASSPRGFGSALQKEWGQEFTPQRNLRTDPGSPERKGKSLSLPRTNSMENGKGFLQTQDSKISGETRHTPHLAIHPNLLVSRIHSVLGLG